jgi:hypothetical protein
MRAIAANATFTSRVARSDLISGTTHVCVDDTGANDTSAGAASTVGARLSASDEARPEKERNCNGAASDAEVVSSRSGTF